jgi:hypothetical protein
MTTSGLEHADRLTRQVIKNILIKEGSKSIGSQLEEWIIC